ncbi:MAG TPA: hypothetical protein VFT41_11640 [Gemmatimonadaceae bacterium]|nr:hypothetical protein [Gemmatimonadaceae bacterium]
MVTPIAVREQIGEAGAGVVRLLTPRLRGPAARVSAYALLNAAARPNVTAVGREYGSRRALERAFRTASLPPPHRLVVLSRWLPVVEVAAAYAPPTGVLAQALGLSTGDVLYKAAIREIRISPREFRRMTNLVRLLADIITAYGSSICALPESESGACRVLTD